MFCKSQHPGSTIFFVSLKLRKNCHSDQIKATFVEISRKILISIYDLSTKLSPIILLGIPCDIFAKAAIGEIQKKGWVFPPSGFGGSECLLSFPRFFASNLIPKGRRRGKKSIRPRLYLRLSL